MSLDQLYRDSDKLLWLKLAEDTGLVLTKKQRLLFLEAPSMEVVARRRRELSKLYPPSPQVAERRYRHYKVMTNEFSSQGFLRRILTKRGIIK